jgi:hypothetical protein
MSNPIINGLISTLAKSPGFQETLGRMNKFVSELEARLDRLEQIAERIEANTLLLREKVENDGR